MWQGALDYKEARRQARTAVAAAAAALLPADQKRRCTKCRRWFTKQGIGPHQAHCKGPDKPPPPPPPAKAKEGKGGAGAGAGAGASSSPTHGSPERGSERLCNKCGRWFHKKGWGPHQTHCTGKARRRIAERFRFERSSI